MITIAPLPDWSDLAALFRTNAFDSQLLAKPWCREGDQAFWFSRTAWSLQAIVLWWVAVNGRNNPSVFIPDYFCNQSLWPLRQTSARLTFYPINADLLPNWNACQKLADFNSPDIFILVHYFGSPSDAKGAEKFCKQNEALLVEDAAHVLYPVSGIGERGDFILYSPHKLLALPDGAVCIVRPSILKSQKESGTAHRYIKDVITSINKGRALQFNWLLKRVVQKTILFSFIALLMRKRESDFGNNPVPTALTIHPEMSFIGKKLLSCIIGNLMGYGAKRRQVCDAWQYLLSNEKEIRPLYDSKINDIIPYMAVFQAKDPDQARVFYDNLRRDDWPVQTWPDMPPEVLEHQEDHGHAIHLRQTLLTLPVHQSMRLKELGKRCLDKISPKHQAADNADVYRLDWDKADQPEWDALLTSAGHSNMLQSWAYGEAKREVEGWTVMRGVILKGSEPVAMVQALGKNMSVGTVISINRGPLWLIQDMSAESIASVFGLIRCQWRWWKRQILLIAPELLDTAVHSMHLYSLGYRMRKKGGWHSARLNLNKTEDELKKELDGKWRNQLRSAEKAGVQLHISCSDKEFTWLMEKYKALQLAKDFHGPSIELYVSFRKNALQQDHVLVMQAVHEGIPVAGLFISRHGDACTYTVGWNSLEGRRINANNFLLWHAMIEMKKRGCTWFDLGGLDEEKVPEITKFKRGMGGGEYKLIGDWL